MRPEAENPRILIVDDDPDQRDLLETLLRRQGFRTRGAESGAAALDLLGREPYALMITDVRMPGMSGLEALRRVREQHPRLPVLLVTAFADVRSAVVAMRDGALNYLAKPIDLDELMASVRLAVQGGAPVPADVAVPPLPADVVVVSPLLRAVCRDAAAIAGSDARALLSGESGVGKEVVAALIHRWSTRAGGPLVKVGCVAVPEAQLEAELFGQELPGGLVRTGRLEQAEAGSLFLDEIAELPAALQSRLLRLLNEGVFRRVGGTRDVRSRARLLVATSRDLAAELAAGRFREDLYYRLSGMEIHVPPLRERPEDILPLASHFSALFSRQQPRFSSSVAAALQAYPWPGNVRELRNAMERAALLSRGEIVLPEHLPARILAAAAPAGEAPRDLQRLEEIEREAILRTLRKNRFNRTETARELAISRRALTYKLQRLRAEGVPVDP